MNMEKILSIFTGVTEEKDEQAKMNKLYDQFCKMSKELLYGGYFLIEENKRLYLDDIEFYYHEELPGGLKDPIMYHTNDNEGKKKPLPYFEMGRLNLHTSGVDVTFENEEKHYRASFLIRGFHVGNEDYDPHSTHIYNEMLYMGLPLGKPIEIVWVSEAQDYKDNYIPIGIPRQNVAEYKYQNGKYTKIECTEKDFDPKLYYRSSGKIFKQCQRKWRFRRNII